MFTRLWSALAGIVDALNDFAGALRALAGTVRATDQHVREQLALPAPQPIPVLTDPEPKKRNKVA